MSDAFPPPPDPANPDPAGQVPPSPPGEPYPGAQQQPYGAPPQYMAPSGYVPPSMDEIWYKPGLNILLTIVTCGIWAIVWSYKTHDDLYKHNGDGINGVIALIIAIFASFVIMFTVPMELEKAYQRRGWQSPESPML